MKRGLAALAALAVLAGGGCAGGSDNIVRTGPANPGVAANGMLTSDPAPLTLADVEREKAGSPERSVAELWFWSQWGSFPDVASLYSSAVRRQLGDARIEDVYARARVVQLQTQMKIVKTPRGTHGRTVAVETRAKNLNPGHESYLLRREKGSWRIAYDTLFERYLRDYVQDLAQGDPTSTQPDVRAVRAGDRAVRALRHAVQPR